MTALRLKQQGLNPVALNFCSWTWAGGGVAWGAGAQEESLFRRSDYHRTLLPYLYPLSPGEAVYSPRMTNPRLARRGGGGAVMCRGDAATFAAQLDLVLATARARGHDAVILGAWGCGAYGCPPRHVAALFAEALLSSSGGSGADGGSGCGGGDGSGGGGGGDSSDGGGGDGSGGGGGSIEEKGGECTGGASDAHESASGSGGSSSGNVGSSGIDGTEGGSGTIVGSGSKCNANANAGASAGNGDISDVADGMKSEVIDHMDDSSDDDGPEGYGGLGGFFKGRHAGAFRHVAFAIIEPQHGGATPQLDAFREAFKGRHIDRLTEELQAVKSQLFAAYKSHGGGDNDDGFDCSGEAEKRFDQLKREVGAVLAAAEAKPGVTEVLLESAGQHEPLQAQVRACEAAVSSLSAICEAAELLEAVDASLAHGKFGDVATALVRSELLLDGLVPTKAGSGGGANANASALAAVDPQALQALRRVLLQRDLTPPCRVHAALRRVLLQRRTAVECRLRESAACGVAVETGTVTVSQSIGAAMGGGRVGEGPLPLKDVLEVLQRLDLMDDWMEELACTLREQVLNPLLDAPHVPPPQISSQSGRRRARQSDVAATGGGGSADLPGGSSASSSGGNAGGPMKLFPQLLERVLVVLKFLAEQALQGGGHAGSLGSALLEGDGGLWGALLQRLERALPPLGSALLEGDGGLWGALLQRLERALPPSAAQLQRFAQLLPACEAFERGWGRWEEHFAAVRRRALLCAARDAMLGDYHNSTPAGDEVAAVAGSGKKALASQQRVFVFEACQEIASQQRVFVFEACQVTQVVQQVLAKAHEALAEACEEGAQVPPLIARELFRTARDVLELFRAVVPARHGEQMQNVPRLAALFHNDCAFLAHHAATIGHRYRQRLPPPVNSVATMVDMIQRQREQLLEFCAGADFVGAVDDDGDGYAFERGGARGELSRLAAAAGLRSGGEGEDGEAAVRRVVYHLKQLSQAWRGVLPASTYARVMGELFEVPAQAVLQQVLAQDEFAEQQTHSLHRLITSLTDMYTVSGLDGTGNGAPLADAARRTRSRLRAVCNLMDSGLQAVGESLSAGVYRHLTREELGSLIAAVFQESGARTAVLAAVERI
ncbi:Centromere/kinetochore Zw10-domain-containing protein [Tribonema minus]|uniref:Centromere/kinetochore Zw10-domain-containing protein n=1 Tax=Tribonema minus TaxID=303371 RepID=A0A836CAB9_9STRA|nr:Centromere/kinetochore Zw10-domain-containing protein [Tribonema minus]